MDLGSSGNIIALILGVLTFLGVRSLFAKFLAGAAHVELADTEKKDDSIKAEETKIQTQVVQSQDVVKTLETKIASTTEETTPENWQEKK